MPKQPRKANGQWKSRPPKPGKGSTGKKVKK